MSDQERVRCRNCGRWIVEVRRRDRAAYPVRVRQPTRWFTLKAGTAEDFLVALHEAAQEQAVGTMAEFAPELLLRHGLVSLADADARLGTALHIQCQKCGHWTTVAPTM